MLAGPFKQIGVGGGWGPGGSNLQSLIITAVLKAAGIVLVRPFSVVDLLAPQEVYKILDNVGKLTCGDKSRGEVSRGEVPSHRHGTWCNNI